VDRVLSHVSARQSLIVLGVGLLVLAPVLVKLAFYPAYPGSDDSFIHMAVAEHILHGDGWGIARNEHVNLSSSPMFTVVLLLILAIGSIGLAQAISLAFACAALAITFLATRTMTSSAACGLAALVVAAANIHLWRWSGTMMETSLGYLTVTVISAATLLLIRAKSESFWYLLGLGILVGLGTEVRFEIGLFLPLTIIALWFAGLRGRLVVVIVGFAVSFAPWVVFATAYFGSPIPTTFFAKATGFHIVNVAIAKQLGEVVASGFGVSMILAPVAVAMVARNTEGRAKLRSYAIPLTFLMAWPIALFGFYYLKMAVLQSAARYYLPGMATWPIAFGLLVGTVPALALHRYRVAAAAGLAACLTAALVLNAMTISPVLAGFNNGYRSAMASGAAYLRANCHRGDVALIYSDIGILAEDGIGACALSDGGALATPSLRGMTLPQAVATVHPAFLVQSIGHHPDELSSQYPGLTLRMVKAYTDHGVQLAGQKDFINIYAVQRMVWPSARR
jgi:4-amino-4-deoxy-L-arabinose transferase-like glycosyltransferase